MVMRFKKTSELPARPGLPTKNQIVQDLENADPNDALFRVTADLNLNNESQEIKEYQLAKDFVATTEKLKEVRQVLSRQKVELAENYEELKASMEEIRKLRIGDELK